MAQKIPHEIPAAHLIAAVLQSDAILGQLQRELYRALPGISLERLRQVLREEILRHETILGPKAEEADALLKRMEQLRAKGLSTTQALKVVTGQAPSEGDPNADVYQILLDDMRHGGEGG
jgi:hypothetical protein